MPKKEILEILESQCPHLEFTEVPSSKCLELKGECTQLNCPIRTEIIANRLVEYIDREGKKGNA